ncbi:MAG: hypothetical protein WBP59_05525 [Ilumatobacteraceae bacterium]
MYDSITSHLTRLARRSWLIVVIALVIGGVLGGLYANRRQSWTGTSTIQVADVSTTASLLGLGGDQGLGVTTSMRPLAIRSAEDFDSTATDTVVVATPDEAASVIVATATGPDAASVEAALADFEAIVERRATDPRLEETDAALRANATTLELFRSDLQALDEQLLALAPDDPARASIAESRIELQSDIRALESSGQSLLEYRALLESNLVATIGTTIDGPGSIITSVIVGIVAMGILLTIVGAGLVITDQKVRRRLQLERIVPGVPILGVLGATTQDGEAEREAARSIERFSGGSDSVALAALTGSDSASTIASMQPLTTCTLRHLGDEQISDDAPFLVIASWGQSTENELAARVAALETVGDGRVGILIVGVPARDLDWAGATGRGGVDGVAVPE